MVKFTGKVKSIVFENEQDLFKILDVQIIGQLPKYPRAEIKVTGSFGEIDIDGTYQFSGQLVMHHKFGLQFKCSSYHSVLPHEEGSLTKYLSSNKFPGIGKKAASKIIDQLGLNALTILKQNPARIDQLDLRQKQKDSLLTGLNQMDSFAEVMLKFAQLGLSRKIATRFYQLHRDDALTQLKKDPYTFVAEVTGYGFKTADRLGQEFGITAQDPRRIKGAIYQVLLTALGDEGDTYVSLAALLTQASKLLNCSQFDPISQEVNYLQKQGKVVVNGENVALANIYQSETEIARTMKELVMRSKKNDEHYSDKQIKNALAQSEQELKIHYDPTQKAAIKNAVSHPISILTGGPGTGKTTIINGILLTLRKLAHIPAAALYSEDPPFLLAAPTGRAAKRMSEITGITAKTIHRLLGLGIGDTEAVDLNELNGEILIIDEMSMVDMFLFKQLLSSIHQTRHIVFVGDKDQLPSVGAGNVFSDLIKSQAFPTTVLREIHRQGNDSTIITLAHDVNQNKNQRALFAKTKNYSFIPCRAALIGQAVGQIVKLALQKGFAKNEIQVLGAMYHGQGGVINLNDILQEIMNPPRPQRKQITVHQEVFRVGDRVLQLQNNPEKDIYNGQIGRVIGINEEDAQKSLIANFDGREINFSKKDLYDLTRAYAITIHKSQGSEFPLVILNLTMQNYVMLKRNLLYTAITRAEKNLVLVGEPRAYLTALNTPGNDRKTGLTEKLRRFLDVKADKKGPQKQHMPAKKKDEHYLLTKEKIYSGLIDPMIGMTGISLGTRKGQ